jgi:5-dehydro-2-deoxygluconokinase
MSGFVTSIADGYNLRDSILRGSASASITVSRPGCAPAMADTNTLKEFMADHPGPTNK